MITELTKEFYKFLFKQIRTWPKISNLFNTLMVNMSTFLVIL